MTTILKNNRKTEIDRVVIKGYRLHPKILLILCTAMIVAIIIDGINLWIISIPKPIILVSHIFGLMAVSVLASQRMAIWEKTTVD